MRIFGKSGYMVVCACSVMSDSLQPPGTGDHPAPLSLEFPRQEYWSGLPFPPPGDRPVPGIEPRFLSLLGGFFTTGLGDSDSKESACNVGDQGSIPGSGRSPGEGNGYPLQYSCLGNLMERGIWRPTVHGVAESDMTEHTYKHTHTYAHTHTHTHTPYP